MSTNIPVWAPLTDFPVNIDEAPVESLVGALLAVYEDQQRFALRSRHDSAPSNYHRSVINNPAIYMPVLANTARHHEDVLRRRNRPLRHAEVIDRLLSATPDQLPVFVPQHKRWLSERAYRAVRNHLRQTFTAYSAAWEIFKDKKKDVEVPADLLDDDEDGDED